MPPHIYRRDGVKVTRQDFGPIKERVMQTLPEGDPEPFMDRFRIYTLRTAEALEHYATTRWPAISAAWPPPATKKTAAFLFVAAPPPQSAASGVAVSSLTIF